MSYIAIIVILAVVTSLGVGIYLINTSRREVGSGPRCGHCGYNLTGSTANRCPECGRLFIEAGILTKPVTSLKKRRLLGVVLILLPLIPTALGFTMAMIYRARAATQVAAAERARAAAAVNFLKQSLSSPASSPSSRPSP